MKELRRGGAELRGAGLGTDVADAELRGADLGTDGADVELRGADLGTDGADVELRGACVETAEDSGTSFCRKYKKRSLQDSLSAFFVSRYLTFFGWAKPGEVTMR